MEKKPKVLNKLGKFILLYSTTLLDNFLSDDHDKRVEKENLANIHAKLQEAGLQNSLLILQLKTEKVDKFEVLVGWTVGKNTNKDQIAIKLKSNPQLIRVISLNMIDKVSILSPSGKNVKLAR
ncbi:hypothetical protein LQF61_10865 [Tetragenococcus koreensis]|uniref:Uncharacterized protein n=1 Tax=Tetragenococcus koreensis TaxID=290335 RepID=A0AAN4ZPT7_9ENTE|nr:hypothetical protein [Tetragenococcus koreensis]AYW45802.1 hypothetical protein C7K43_07465 [Tetragenococcus koreensis]MCF1585908.1 hypothetical protein [Tetragenococcus koreensis]MCF1615485.1 hypothetical protein [Tetragenococcus koreensis]MCF1617585.1 hypothetical protein [Tetragenococcus koreensis]MCF1620571.1 hypothetical protein [Tetragenococcus koreensis]